MRSTLKLLSTSLLAIPLLAASVTISGCDNKEDVIEVETPGGEIDVERDRDTGAVDVDVNN